MSLYQMLLDAQTKQKAAAAAERAKVGAAGPASAPAPVIRSDANVDSKGRLTGQSAKNVARSAWNSAPNAQNYSIDQTLHGQAQQGYQGTQNAINNYGQNADYQNMQSSRAAQMQDINALRALANQPQQDVVGAQTRLQQDAARRAALSQLAAGRANNPGAVFASQMGASNAASNIAANSMPAFAQQANNQYMQRLAANQAVQQAGQGLTQQDLAAAQLRNQYGLGQSQLGLGYSQMGQQANTQQSAANQAYDANSLQAQMQKLAMIQGQKQDPNAFQKFVMPIANMAGQVGSALAGLV